MFIFFQGLPEQIFFSYKQEGKLACGFCPCCRNNLRSETSALFLLLAFSPNWGWEAWIRGAYPAALEGWVSFRVDAEHTEVKHSPENPHSTA